MLEEALKKFHSSKMDFSVFHELLSVCIQDRGSAARDHVRHLFADDYGGHTFKWEFKEPAGMALLAWGDAGIEEIKRVFVENDNYANRTIVFDILSAAAAGKGPVRVALGASSDIWAQITDRGELT